MKTPRIFRYITDKPLWVNVLAGLGLIVVITLLFFGSLDWITGYGKYEKVPSVMGQQVIIAKKLLEDKGFDVIIQDSVYIDSLPKQAVLRQSPEADATVKAGRTIYLTINRTIAPQVEMPNLIGFSVRSAELYLQSLQLKMGTVSYKPDIARNSVLEQLLGDAPIAPGAKVPLGTSINLVLGSGEGGSTIDVPNLIGMTLEEARNYLSTLSVNIGSIIAVGAIRDSATSFIVRQTPGPQSDEPDADGKKLPNKIKQGQVIDLYIGPVAPVRDTLSNPSNN